MPICKYCGEKFNLTYARKRIGRLYGANAYNDYFEDGDVCDRCAIEEISPDFGTGEDQIADMGSGWEAD